MKQIAFLHSEFPAGGAEHVTIKLANFLAATGKYQTTIFCTCHQTELYPTERKDFCVQVLPYKRMRHKKNLLFLIEKIKELGIDVLVIQNISFKHIKELCQYTTCKLIYANHSKPLWEVTHAELTKRERSKKAFRKKLRWLLWEYPQFHGIHFYKNKIIKRYKQNLKYYDQYIVLCNGYRDEIIKELHLTDSTTIRKIKVLNNSQEQVENPQLHKSPIVLFVGRITYSDKRIDRLLDIWNLVYPKLPDWKLWIVGDGPARSSLEEQTRRQNLQHVVFKGFSKHVEEYYRDAAILCLTSTFEGWPLALAEAQAHGVIPMAFDCSAGVHELLQNGNGILIPPFCIEKYADELFKLAIDKELQASIQKRVIRNIEQYNISIIGQEFIRIIESGS
ncbi:MAG: glycosyltransferase [Bacteroides sp.]|nr:glycosyltransferase [Bacteroides sp.]